MPVEITIPLQPMTGAELQACWDNQWVGGDWYYEELYEIENENGDFLLDLTKTYSADEIDAITGCISYNGYGPAPVEGATTLSDGSPNYEGWSFSMFIYHCQQQTNPNVVLSVTIPKEKRAEFEAFVASIGGGVL
jgi:hypothetical protein